jgi:AraC family transcriptional regulator
MPRHLTHMLRDLSEQTGHLPAGEARHGRVTTRLIHSGSGDGGFAFRDLTLGFVFKGLDRHEAAYGSDRRRHVPLSAGAGWLLPADADGACAWDGPSTFLNVHFDADLLMQVTGGARPAFAPRYAHVDDTALRIALDLHQAEGADAVSRIYRESMTLALAAHVVRSLERAPPALTPSARLEDQRLARVADHVEANLTGDLSLDTLAGIAAMSAFHFARSFKAATGEPPHKFVMRRRVERAKVLLRTTTAPVAEIAFRVGWENPSHFAQAFKAVAGVSPGIWRNGA